MTTQAVLPMPFNAAQLELIKLFAAGINNEDLAQLRQILIDFKFSKVTQLADQILDKRNWSESDLAANAQKVKRSPYKAKRKKQNTL